MIELSAQKLFILVKNFAWTNEDVEIFKTSKEAALAFKKYTGFNFNDNYFDRDNKDYNEKFAETKIYEICLPDFLELKKKISVVG